MRTRFRRGAAALLGGALVLLGVGFAGLAFGGAAGAATGANFVATGHDMDFHCAGGGSEGDLECQYLKIALAKVRAGSTLPVLSIDHGTEVKTALTTSIVGLAAGTITTVDPDDATAFNALKFTKADGTPLYSAIIVASDSTCGGCDNTTTSITDINARKSDFATFFNHGGGILALAGAENRATYYNFVPVGLTSTAVSAPFTVQPAGKAIGVTTDMANCCPTHNSFQLPKKPFVTLETDSLDKAETIAVFNASIGGGGFTSAAPSSTAASTTKASAAPSTTAATTARSSASASSSSSSDALAATGANATHGGVRLLVLAGLLLLVAGTGLAWFGYRRPMHGTHRAH